MDLLVIIEASVRYEHRSCKNRQEEMGRELVSAGSSVFWFDVYKGPLCGTAGIDWRLAFGF